MLSGCVRGGPVYRCGRVELPLVSRGGNRARARSGARCRGHLCRSGEPSALPVRGCPARRGRDLRVCTRDARPSGQGELPGRHLDRACRTRAGRFASHGGRGRRRGRPRLRGFRGHGDAARALHAPAAAFRGGAALSGAPPPRHVAGGGAARAAPVLGFADRELRGMPALLVHVVARAPRFPRCRLWQHGEGQLCARRAVPLP